MAKVLTVRHDAVTYSVIHADAVENLCQCD